MNILVADDAVDCADALAVCLRDKGHHVSTAADGVECLTKLRMHHPDVLVLDLLMPAKNGWEVLDEKGREPDIANIPVVVMSGYTTIPEPLPTDQVRAVVPKPTDPDDVLTAISKVTKQVGGTV